MCVPLAVVAAGTAAVGTMVGGIQSMMTSNYEASVAKRNAALAREGANDSRMRGYTEARDFFRQAGQIKGQQIASMAANGIDVDFGSARRVQEDTEALLSEDAAQLYENINQRTRGFDIDFSNNMGEAQAAKFRGRQAMTGAVFGAASSLMSGMSQNRGLRPNITG